MFRSVVYHGNSLIGEVEIQPKNSNLGTWTREIRISHFSHPSDRCPPLAVLHTISTSGVCFSMESKRSADESLLFSVYSACLREKKTAVASTGEEELHLVAMPSRRNIPQHSCFWGFISARGLYNSCLVMLNLRCLGIVFDLDETLIVANTMRSLEDKIDGLQRKISSEMDPQRANGMLAEMKRYQEDKSILKQYVDGDQVVENGKVFKTQSEAVPPLSGSHQLLTRPIIRLHEKNIILTRVNPLIRDTSVLVRLRPAWEDLRSYLTAKGRKRFEVYVCTMAERDYALEMWRLLDPECNLINSRELLDRIVCVKSGLRKSLFSVFQDGVCHPKISLVIDDRLKVWDEKDQSRVHVVPPFAPHFGPQAEANNNIPVLCVARNVACNVRGSFFKDFDEVLLPRMSEMFYEDEMEYPSAPDVGNYLIPEDDTSTLIGNKNPLGFDGMADAEVERRLKVANRIGQSIPPIVNNFDTRAIVPPGPTVIAPTAPAVSLTTTQLIMPLTSNQFPNTVVPGKPLVQPVPSEHSLQGSAWEEGEVPESDLDPNTRRRLLILQHGQDTRDTPPHPPFPARPPLQVSVPPVQPRGNWFPVEECLNSRQANMVSRDVPLEHEAMPFDKNRTRYRSFYRTGEKCMPSDRLFSENQRLPMQVHHSEVRPQPNKASSNFISFQGNEMSMTHVGSNHNDAHLNLSDPHYEDTPVGFLREISRKCGTKIEFKSSILDTIELQFSMEVWFVGEKIGEGIGRTRKEAQRHAAENSLQSLANKYLTLSADATHTKEIGFSSDLNSSGYPDSTRNEFLPGRKTALSHLQSHEVLKRTSASVVALKELCMMEGYNLVFQAPTLPAGVSISKGKVYAQVEISGQVLGKGIGLTWEDAKIQAAEEALDSLKSKAALVPILGPGSSRMLPASSNKRLKQDLPQLQRIPS